VRNRVRLKENRVGSGSVVDLRAVRVKLQVPPLRYPGFPVQLSGVGGTAMQEIRVRCGRDDKVEGSGTP
jgi:hypothetical protein